jgi:N-acetylglucosaminyl-diphospho-decaprenol L-rhamnosyltransferase
VLLRPRRLEVRHAGIAHTETMGVGVSTGGLQGLTTVVVNWETPANTTRCARAVIGEGVPPSRIVLVDNGSADDSVERFRRELPECRLVVLEKNQGYANAANAGASALRGDAYLILNNDAFVHRGGSVSRMMAALGGDGIGIVVPRLLNPDLTLQRSVKPIDTPLVALVRASGMSRFIPNRWQPDWSTHWDHSESRLITAADGAVLLVKGEAWDQLGGLSSRRHMYAEDTDLCWRAKRTGWQLWFEADAEFVHLGNATTGRRWSSPQRAEQWSRSEAHLLREHLSPPVALLSIGFTALGLAARTAYFGLRRERGRADQQRAQLRGYLSAIRPRTGP